MDTATKRVATGRANRKRGEAVEGRVAALLADMGYVMIERVHTPFTVIRKGGKIVGAFPKAKVSGDYRAVTGHSFSVTAGRSVLVEVKSRPGRLLWSSIKPHQRAALDEHAQFSSHTWLFFCDTQTDEIHKYRWPVDGFCKGKSLKPEGGDDG